MTATGKPKLKANESEFKPNLLETKTKEPNGNLHNDIEEIGTDFTYKHKIVWKNAILFGLLHVYALWGLGVILTGGIGLKTLLFGLTILFIASEGITIAAHRYYTHRTFKAKPLLRVIFIIAQTIAGENSVYTWVRDHRLHHRYSDTDADPHNAKRGFFFSHVGWLMMRKHPYVAKFGQQIDMSDMTADWMVMLQKKYYLYFYFMLAVFMPMWIPVQYFGESWKNSMLTCYFCRYAFQLNATWLVNSAAHLYGTRPYDKNLQPVESWFVSWLTMGEGWHNYHHAFPWDYKAAELTTLFNYSANAIKFFEMIGLAYDLKTVSPEVVDKRILRSGDGTHYVYGNEKARDSVEAFGIVHPMNLTYNVKYPMPSNITARNKVEILRREKEDVFKLSNCIDTRKEASG